MARPKATPDGLIKLAAIWSIVNGLVLMALVINYWIHDGL